MLKCCYSCLRVVENIKPLNYSMDENIFMCKGMDRKLYRVSESGDVKLLDQVLNDGTVDVLQQLTPARDTALHTAALHGHTQLAKKLILFSSEDAEAGRRFLKAQNTDGNTALHVAASRGCTRIVKKLVEEDISLTSVKNNGGETALFKASENGREYCVKCLLENTPESEELDRRADGQTPLHAAVSQLHAGVTSMLLEKRPALVNKADAIQRTALHILALVLPQRAQIFSHLFSKIFLSSIEKIGKMLLDKNISLMYRVGANGQTALHLAAKVGNAPLVKVILSYATDCAQISDKDGRTALHLAVENASQIYNKLGPYHLKALISSLTLMRLINCSDKSGQTALDIAIHKYEEDQKLFQSISNYLKKHGARRKMLGTETREGSGSLPSTGPKSNWRMQIISVNAALIATVAFQAALTPPQNIDSISIPPTYRILKMSLLKLFVILDSVAFCSSLASAVLLLFALFGDQQLDPVIANICHFGLWIAVTSISLTFGVAIYVVVGPKDYWLALVVWIMACSIPIGIMLMAAQGKRFLFMKQWQYWVGFIALLLSLMMSLSMVLVLVILIILGYLTMLLVRKLCRARKKWQKED